MFDPPKTKEEARKIRYGKWAGKPDGIRYVEGICAYEVSHGSRAVLFRQCNRRNGHGPDGLYCKQHVKKFTEND